MISVQEGKKKKHGRINQEDVFVTNYSGNRYKIGVVNVVSPMEITVVGSLRRL